MSTYESTFICSPELPAEKLEEIVEKVKKVIDASQGTILTLQQLGKKKMSYPIKKFREGSYIYMELSGSGSMVGSLETFYKVNDAVIRYLTVKVEKKKKPPVKEKIEGSVEEVKTDDSIKLETPQQNSVTIVGRVTRDPEVRFTAKGQAVCRLDVAVNRRYKDAASGEWKDDTSFIPVVVWGESASRCGERLKKGLPVHVEGRLQSRNWETKEGQKRTSIEVVARRVQFLSKPVTDSAESEAAESKEPTAVQTSEDEEIPF